MINVCENAAPTRKSRGPKEGFGRADCLLAGGGRQEGVRDHHMQMGKRICSRAIVETQTLTTSRMCRVVA